MSQIQHFSGFIFENHQPFQSFIDSVSVRVFHVTWQNTSSNIQSRHYLQLVYWNCPHIIIHYWGHTECILKLHVVSPNEAVITFMNTSVATVSNAETCHHHLQVSSIQAIVLLMKFFRWPVDHIRVETGSGHPGYPGQAGHGFVWIKWVWPGL